MKNPRGFTLIEFVMIIAIGSIVTLGVVLFTRQEVETTNEMRNLLIATSLAQLKMAEMNNTAYASLSVGTITLAAEASFPGYMIQRVITAVSTSGTVTLRRIDINVAPVTGSFSNPLVKLTTYRQSNTTFGNGV